MTSKARNNRTRLYHAKNMSLWRAIFFGLHTFDAIGDIGPTVLIVTVSNTVVYTQLYSLKIRIQTNIYNPKDSVFTIIFRNVNFENCLLYLIDLLALLRKKSECRKLLTCDFWHRLRMAFGLYGDTANAAAVQMADRGPNTWRRLTVRNSCVPLPTANQHHHS